MKRLILFSLAGILLLSCEKDRNNEPPSDFHGTWKGTWTTNDNSMHGNFVAPANQSGDEITGEVFVNILFPDEEGYRPEYTAHVEGDEARVLFSVSGVDIQVKADLISESEISGTFLVPGYFEGTFSGTKSPLTIASTTDIYTIHETEAWYENMYRVDNQFWLLNYMTSLFEVVDQSGNLVGTRDAEMIGFHPAFSDGTFFWVYGKDYYNLNNAVYKMTSEGEILDSILMKRDNLEALYVKDDVLYCSFFAGRSICEVDNNGNLIDSVTVDFLYPTDYIVYPDGILVAASYSPYIFYIDYQGNILYTYQVENGIYSMIEGENGEYYCFTDELIYGDGEVSDTYRVIKFNLNLP